MPPEGIYRVAYQVAETVSATWRPQRTDSAPVRVTLRARPNSFSSAYRTSASHALCLSDVLGKTYWVGRAQERHDELARTSTVPYRSPYISPQPSLTTTLQLPQARRSLAFLRAHRRASLTD